MDRVVHRDDADRPVGLEDGEPDVVESGDPGSPSRCPDVIDIDAFLIERLGEDATVADQEPRFAFEGLLEALRPARRELEQVVVPRTA